MDHGTEHHNEQNHGTGCNRVFSVLVIAFFLSLFASLATQASADINPPALSNGWVEMISPLTSPSRA